MELVHQIKQLVTERDRALRKAEELGRQIAEIRAALGVPDEMEPAPPVRPRVSPSPRRSEPRPVAMGGLSQSQILKLLAEREPRSTADLIVSLPDITTVRLHLKAMADAGALVRYRKADGGVSYWYARSEAAFDDGDFVRPHASAEVIAPHDGFRPDGCGDERPGLSPGDEPMSIGSAAVSAR